MRLNRMPTNTTEGLSPYDSSSVSEIVESFVESNAKLAESLDASEERVSDFKEAGRELGALLEQLNEEPLSHFREEAVHTVAVERVLLEYGISGERVDEIIETVEAVDSELWGDDDE